MKFISYRSDTNFALTHLTYLTCPAISATVILLITILNNARYAGVAALLQI